MFGNGASMPRERRVRRRKFTLGGGSVRFKGENCRTLPLTAVGARDEVAERAIDRNGWRDYGSDLFPKASWLSTKSAMPLRLSPYRDTEGRGHSVDD